VISLPDPCLVVLVGAAGSGKTTLAARVFDPDSVLSSDAHRALIAGNETDQASTKTAFSILHRRLVRRLAERRTTVIDATNVQAHARRSLVRRSTHAGIPAVAIVLALDPMTVRARNATRPGRIVPEAAVSQQLEDLERSLRRDALASEGFEAVHMLRTARELDELTVEWRPRVAASGPTEPSGPPR
jgi:protein phosphatase